MPRPRPYPRLVPRRYELSTDVPAPGPFSALLGFRYVSGLADIDGLQGTGLEDINDDSGRWTLPFMVGLRVKF